MPLLEVSSLTKDYELGGLTSRVLKGIDLSIEPGQFVAVMGPSGSGKSTFMNIIGTLDRQTGGEYTLEGRDIATLDPAELAAIRNEKIGFVFQGFNLLSRRNVLDNIALPLLYAGVPNHERLERARALLERVGLSTHGKHMPNQLSGGQQQRVAIARALVNHPKLILADEPTGNLDSKTSKEIMHLFQELNAAGITIVLVTHEQDVAQYAKHLVQFKDGEIIYDGPMY